MRTTGKRKNILSSTVHGRHIPSHDLNYNRRIPPSRPVGSRLVNHPPFLCNFMLNVLIEREIPATLTLREITCRNSKNKLWSVLKVLTQIFKSSLTTSEKWIQYIPNVCRDIYPSSDKISMFSLKFSACFKVCELKW